MESNDSRGIADRVANTSDISRIPLGPGEGGKGEEAKWCTSLCRVSGQIHKHASFRSSGIRSTGIRWSGPCPIEGGEQWTRMLVTHGNNFPACRFHGILSCSDTCRSRPCLCSERVRRTRRCPLRTRRYLHQPQNKSNVGNTKIRCT